MKRSALSRKTPLAQGSGLASRDSRLSRTPIAPISAKRRAEKPSAAEVAGRDAWHQATVADPVCAHCGRRSAMSGHHVILKRHVAAKGGDVWDLRNRLSLDPACHLAHHESSGRHRVSRAALRPDNIAFARELLGEAADEYLDRHYPSTPSAH